MCGLLAHAVQLHELWSIFRRQKQHAKKVYLQNNSRESLLQRGEILAKFRGEGVSQFSGQRGNSVVSFTPAPVISPLCSCKLFHRPTERGSVSRSIEITRVCDGALQHPEDTVGSTLVPISRGSVLRCKNKWTNKNIVSGGEKSQLSHSSAEPAVAVQSGIGCSSA